MFSSKSWLVALSAVGRALWPFEEGKYTLLISQDDGLSDLGEQQPVTRLPVTEVTKVCTSKAVFELESLLVVWL